MIQTEAKSGISWGGGAAPEFWKVFAHKRLPPEPLKKHTVFYDLKKTDQNLIKHKETLNNLSILDHFQIIRKKLLTQVVLNH